MHPDLDFDYHRLPGLNKPHLNEFETAEGKKKILRIESGAFVNREEAELSVATFSDYLDLLHKRGVATLDPVYKIGEDSHGGNVVYIIVDEIEHPIHFDEVVESLNPRDLAVYDRLAETLVDAVREACRNGGWIFPEAVSLGQYVIDDDSIDRVPILIDVMPEGHAYLPETRDDNGIPSYSKVCLGDALRWLIEDVIKLDAAFGDVGSQSYAALRMALDDPKVAALLDPTVIGRLRTAHETRDSSMVSVDDEWWEYN